MSHFVTLVDFYMPEVEENLEETAHYKAQIAEAKEALAQSQGGNSFALRLILNQLQSKVNPLDRAAECEIGELMAPFCENTEDSEYLEFIDRTDEGCYKDIPPKVSYISLLQLLNNCVIFLNQIYQFFCCWSGCGLARFPCLNSSWRNT